MVFVLVSLAWPHGGPSLSAESDASAIGVGGPFDAPSPLLWHPFAAPLPPLRPLLCRPFAAPLPPPLACDMYASDGCPLPVRYDTSAVGVGGGPGGGEGRRVVNPMAGSPYMDVNPNHQEPAYVWSTPCCVLQGAAVVRQRTMCDMRRCLNANTLGSAASSPWWPAVLGSARQCSAVLGSARQRWWNWWLAIVRCCSTTMPEHAPTQSPAPPYVPCLWRVCAAMRTVGTWSRRRRATWTWRRRRAASWTWARTTTTARTSRL